MRYRVGRARCHTAQSCDMISSVVRRKSKYRQINWNATWERKTWFLFCHTEYFRVKRCIMSMYCDCDNDNIHCAGDAACFQLSAKIEFRCLISDTKPYGIRAENYGLFEKLLVTLHIYFLCVLEFIGNSRTSFASFPDKWDQIIFVYEKLKLIFCGSESDKHSCHSISYFFFHFHIINGILMIAWF